MTLQECSENLTDIKNQRKDFDKNQKALELEIKKFNNQSVTNASELKALLDQAKEHIRPAV